MPIELTKPDFTLGWRGIPGWFSEEEAAVLQDAVRRAEPGTAIVELGSWCGRSLSAITEALPEGVKAFAYDNHLGGSQAEVTTEGALSATEAKSILQAVVKLQRSRSRDVAFIEAEAVAGGQQYSGPPIAALFIDDHHSPEQVTQNLKVWGPHLAPKCRILFHDWGAEELYHLQVAIRPILTVEAGWRFLGQFGSIGVFERG